MKIGRKSISAISLLSCCRRVVVAVVVVVASIASSAQTDARALIDQSVQAETSDWDAAPQYECFERDRTGNGRTKTFEDLMIAGSPYQRLVAVNGKPLPQQEQEEQGRQLDETREKRRNESADERNERIAKYQKSRDRDHLFLSQLAKGFTFTVVGQQRMAGNDVYMLKAVPRSDYQPPNTESEVLKGMRGTLWIDKKTYQWVKVEARVTRPVRIEGFLAEVEPGTQFELEKMPVDDNIWLPKHYVMKARAKVFFLFNHKSGDDETYYDCRKMPSNQQSSTAK